MHSFRNFKAHLLRRILSILKLPNLPERKHRHVRVEWIVQVRIRWARIIMATMLLVALIPMVHSVGSFTYYLVRNKVVAKIHWFGHLLVRPDDAVYIDAFAWWPYAMRIGYYLANPGGPVMVPPNYSETLAANLVLSKSKSGFQFTGPATIIMAGFQVTQASGINGSFIQSPYAVPLDGAGNCTGVCFVGYTGSGPAFNLGDSSGFALNLAIKGIGISLVNAQAGAIAIKLTNVADSVIDQVAYELSGTVNNQIGIQTLGTGAFFCGIIAVRDNLWQAGTGAGTGQKAVQLSTQTNAVNISGGHVTLGGAAVAGTVAVDQLGNSSSGNYVWGLSIDNTQTAVTVEGTTTGALYAFIRPDSTLTSSANFGAGTAGNVVYLMGSQGALTKVDNGTNNSVQFSALSTFNGDAWQVSQGNNVYFITNNQTGKNRLNFAAANTQLNPEGGGALQFNSAASQGDGTARFYNAAASPVEALRIDGAAGISSCKSVSVYNGLSTAGTGLAQNLGTPVNLTGQVANLGATTIYTTAASGCGSAGLYRVCVTTWTTGTGNTTTLQANIVANNGAGASTTPVGPVLSTSALTNAAGGSCGDVHVAASQAIQVSTTGYNTTGTYSIQATVEQVF